RPAKDSMGMDYVPVYEGESAGASGGGAGAGPDGGATSAEEGVAGYTPVSVSPEGLALAGVRTVNASRGRLRRVVRAVGLVTPDEGRERVVTLKTGGYIERLFVAATGEPVRAGEPIVSIYSPEVLAAEGEYLSAVKNAQALSSAETPGTTSGSPSSDANGDA